MTDQKKKSAGSDHFRLIWYQMLLYGSTIVRLLLNLLELCSSSFTFDKA